MTEQNKILDAVKQLDAKNDGHWTADGLPRLEAVRELASDTSLTREQVSAAAPDYKRSTAEEAAATPPAPPAPTGDNGAGTTPTPPAPPAAPEGGDKGAQDGGSASAPPPPAPPVPDEGVRGTIGAGAPEAPLAPALDTSGGPVPPQDVDANQLPQPDPRTTAPAADGLPTANEPTRTEGAESSGLKVDEVSGRSGPGGDPIPEIAKGATTLGYNAMNSEADDQRDALASVAPSPNAPTSLGGPIEPEDLDGVDADGLTTPADVLASEAQLAPLDRGHPGDPDALPALREELAAAEAKSEKLRVQADKVQGQLNEAAAEESRIRAAIELATPRTGHMEAVQGFFAAQDRHAEEQAQARQAILESGVDLKALGKLVERSPLDQAALIAPRN